MEGKKKLSFKIKTLGCKVNQVESEEMIGKMLDRGYVYRKEGKTDIAIINTCTVTSKADRKSLFSIEQSIKSSEHVFVTGCYSQLEKNLMEKKAGIRKIVDQQNKKHIPDIIEASIGVSNPSMRPVDGVVTPAGFPGNMYKLDKTHLQSRQHQFYQHSRSFLKIQDGCNDFCSYCRIPFARGVPVSRDPEDIFRQVEELKRAGSPEIVLTGINLGKYRHNDWDFSYILEAILEKANPIPLRISSIEPMSLSKKALEAMKRQGNLVPHIHLSLQSGSDAVLKVMRRSYTTEDFYTLVRTLREINPHFSITTDVIVGFPGETELHFEETRAFIKKCGFTKLHVFPFSKRPLTQAEKMVDDVSPLEKKRRVKELTQLSDELYQTYLSQLRRVEQRFVVEKEIVDENELLFSEISKENFKHYYVGTTEYYIKSVLISDVAVKETVVSGFSLNDRLVPLRTSYQR